jgi:hypothetical protein
MRLALTVDLPVLDRKMSWAELEALMVELGHRAPAQVLALVLDEAQEGLVEQVCGPRRAPRAGREPGGGQPAPFACPGCGAREGFVRKGRRTRARTLRTAAGVLKLRVWHVGCTRAGCRKVFSPLLVMLGLSGKRRTDRLTLDLAELGTQMSFARSAAVDRLLAGTDATATAAHRAMADLAAVLASDGEPEPTLPGGHNDSHDNDGHDDDGHDRDGHDRDGHDRDGHDRDGHGDGDGRVGDPGTAGSGAGDGRAFFRDPLRVLGPAITRPLVVLLDGTGARAGAKKNGVPVNLAIGLTGRSGPPGRRRAHTHLLGLTVNQDWSMMGAQLNTVAAPALAVVDGETEITVLAQRLWPGTPIQRCWWHLPHGLRKAFYADDAANRHVNPAWARTKCDRLAELLREQIRNEHTIPQALAAWDELTATIPAALTSARTYLDTARPHAFTCLDPALRRALAPIGGPELGTGVLERLMREINARTDIGGVRWTPAGLRDTLTVTCARILHHPAWTECVRNLRPASTITFSLQKFNAA